MVETYSLLVKSELVICLFVFVNQEPALEGGCWVASRRNIAGFLDYLYIYRSM